MQSDDDDVAPPSSSSQRVSHRAVFIRRPGARRRHNKHASSLEGQSALLRLGETLSF